MKFDEIKNIPAWELLSLLQKLVKENAEKIKKNSTVPLNNKREENFSENSAETKSSQKNQNFKNVYLQNSFYIDLHHKLFSFLKELSEGLLDEGTENKNEKVSAEEIEKIKEFEFQFYLEETLKGSLTFNSSHPFNQNQQFIQALIGEYTNTEEYEKCAVLVERLNSLKKSQ